MNIYLLFACMIFLPVIAGTGILRVLYPRQKVNIADALITGWMFVIGAAEVAHLSALFLSWNFSRAAKAAVMLFLSFTFLCGMVCFSCREKKQKERKRRVLSGLTKQYEEKIIPLSVGCVLLVVIVVIFQVVTITSQDSIYRAGDMTTETVESFLREDAVYAVNPLTGRAYEEGVPLRIQILGLPTLYGILGSCFGVDTVTLVEKCIPLFVLLLSYCAFHLIACALFDGEKEWEKRLIFMTFVALLFCAGDYAWGMDGFGLLHCGFRGVVFRNLVLVPYAFSLALRRKRCLMLFVLAAEACITWTFYGMGVCVVIFSGMALAEALYSRRKKTLSVGKEGSFLCGK